MPPERGDGVILPTVKQKDLKLFYLISNLTVKLNTMKTKLVAGDAAPNFTAKDQNNKDVSLMNYSGRKVALVFYVHNGKKGVDQELTKIQNDLNRIEAKGINVIAISPDSVESNAKTAQEYGITFPILSDEDEAIARAYHVYGSKKEDGDVQEGVVRTTFLIGSEGTIEAVLYPVKERHAGAQILDTYRKFEEGEKV